MIKQVKPAIRFALFTVAWVLFSVSPQTNYRDRPETDETHNPNPENPVAPNTQGHSHRVTHTHTHTHPKGHSTTKTEFN